ncbi:MAG: hypothetical protein M3N13_03175 [Candidatus Eremiobacteraeota bacterium]|nr:hypothetical protein [Candidatus Eremiobacteraeota bacterium]
MFQSVSSVPTVRAGLAAFTLLAVALNATGCSSVVSTQGPSTIRPCAIPTAPSTAPPLIYPISGAVGVSTAASTLVFAGRVDNVTAVLEPQASTTPFANPAPTAIALGSFSAVPSPIPSPHATITDVTALTGIAYPQLHSHVTYRIDFSYHPPSGTCSLFIPSAGFFTTQ